MRTTMIALAGAFFASATAYAATGEGTVQDVYQYGGGSVVVTGLYFTNSSCTNNHGFLIEGNHPNFSRLLAVVLTARALGARVRVEASGANCWYPTISFDNNHYVLMLP
jgi:hypothetical protein